MLQNVRNQTSTFRSGTLLLVFGLPVLLLAILPLIALVGSLDPRTLTRDLASESTQQALRLSLTTSLISAGLVALFGTPLAWLLARKNSKGRGALNVLLQLALFVPPAVAGLGLLSAFGPNGFCSSLLRHFGIGLVGTPVAVVLAQCFVSSPYFIRSAAAGLAGIDPALAKVLKLEGAGRWQVFRHAVAPVAWPAFVIGAAMAWARSLGEFGATLIFAGNLPGRTQTLPLAVYFNLGTGMNHAVVLASILLMFSLLLLLLVNCYGTRKIRPV